MTTKESTGQRGKKAERLVEAVLKKWNGKADFAYWRLPDSRSARNFLAAQPGDYAYFSHPHGGIVEVKETQHPRRIAKDKISQLPVLQKFALAGAKSVILIHHSVEGKWRMVLPSQLEFGKPSWDLSGFAVYESAEEALLASGYFNQGEKQE